MITLYIDKTHFNASGHAGYADRGHDIVCAAVSALAQSAALAIVAYDTDAVVQTGDGELECGFRIQDDYTAGIMDALTIGAFSIADTYGDYLQVVCDR